MNQVSVIIPNFNADKYIKECIDSILYQDYDDIQIVIIDDGSIDQSWEIIQNYTSRHKNIIAKRQYNLNASIARNTGMKMATGDYFLFLDSDDILELGAIRKMVFAIENQNVDLVIGNYTVFDSNRNIHKYEQITKKNTLVANPFTLVGIVPNPTTKLYKKDIIYKNNIFWGNVRIGQDLNFFLKYLSCIHNAYLLNENIYNWRRVNTSITNSYSFHIFDITTTFKDIFNFYQNNNLLNKYYQYISVIEFRHYYQQMEKQKFFHKLSERKLIIHYFSYYLNSLDLKEALNYKEFKSEIYKCKFKLLLRWLYISKIYKFLDRNFTRRRQ